MKEKIAAIYQGKEVHSSMHEKGIKEFVPAKDEKEEEVEFYDAMEHSQEASGQPCMQEEDGVNKQESKQTNESMEQPIKN
ncbi:hypothetical protein KI387_002635, partial [Taxus chinensis]